MKLGLVLGGGGAKGFAHLGVVEVLSEAGIEFDVVAGTSIGALVGAVYISGELEAFEDFARGINLSRLPAILGPTWPSRGLFTVKYLEKLIRKYVKVEKIEELGKPFACVSVDLRNAETVTFRKGEILTAIRASISIPGLFTPVEHDGRLLVDGGVLESLPVDAARSLGSDFVVAVDLLSDLGNADNPSLNEKMSIVDVIQRSSVITQRKMNEYRFRDDPPDIVIAPPVSGVKVMDFHKGESIMEIGRTKAREMLPAILEKLDG